MTHECHPKSNLLRSFFREKCIVNGKKNTPINFLINSEQNRLKLLAGIIDTDGGFDAGGSCRVVSVVKSLAEQYAFLARSLGFAVYVKKNKNWNKKYGICW